MAKHSHILNHGHNSDAFDGGVSPSERSVSMNSNVLLGRGIGGSIRDVPPLKRGFYDWCCGFLNLSARFCSNNGTNMSSRRRINSRRRRETERSIGLSLEVMGRFSECERRLRVGTDVDVLRGTEVYFYTCTAQE